MSDNNGNDSGNEMKNMIKCDIGTWRNMSRRRCYDILPR